ncbi:MAG TPA: poly-beta-1,6-N-acetyl-D-glucosamine synthase [Usitatibacter sp.]|nr:poly-beta-1,6-N-acetyl-D-glucosamine synthase [Usitatibacter sp.]
MTALDALLALCFGYPFVMSWYWIVGGLLHEQGRERFEPPPDAPPRLDAYPPVSILVPCFNEEDGAEETFAALDAIDYPEYEIIAINDGSRDRTAQVLAGIAARMPRLRVVNLATNQGKSTALNVGALAARSEILVCIDGDALLDRHALTWMVRRFQSDAHLGALTGNPRIRNRASLLGRLQVGEFSAIVGLVRRAQTVYGALFTVSGVICAFRKRALHEAGWWSPAALTDDVDVSWRIQIAHWGIAYEPKAMCWILMPETLRGLWRQRLRWAEGGAQTILGLTNAMFTRHAWHLVPTWLNYLVSMLWAYAMLIAFLAWLVAIAIGAPPMGVSALPGNGGLLLALIYFIQAMTSAVLDRRYEKGLGESLFWVVWYPLAFWMLQAATAVVGLPRALRRPVHARGTWVSPDRGFR